MKKKKGNGLAWGLGLIAAAMGVLGWVIYKSTQKATATVAASVAATSNVNTLAGNINGILSSIGLAPKS